MSIPKKIHYCWFGRGEKPKLAKKCIDSWKKFCPDYEIIEWNEDNFDIAKYPYAQFCLENRKWAFLSDFVRLVVVYENGGIYFDTDVEAIKSFDDLLDLKAFYGFEVKDFVSTGLAFGAEKGNETVLSMINQYLALRPNENGQFPIITCPELNTEALLPFGLKLNGQYQDLGQAVVFPADFFNPYDNPTGRLKKTKNTYSIHWYGKSWLSKGAILRSKLTKPLHRLLGTDFFHKKK
ncbi:MAG: glycosyl transferase [Clostridia bacterium]|nr:glycosyl transferase [Clostridia bacterium]